jgi:hypothetical protein
MRQTTEATPGNLAHPSAGFAIGNFKTRHRIRLSNIISSIVRAQRTPLRWSMQTFNSDRATAYRFFK